MKRLAIFFSLFFAFAIAAHAQGLAIGGTMESFSLTDTNGKVQTFVYAAYGDPRDYPGFDSRGNADPTEGIADIHGLSHEVAEWANNPFLSNQVPIWANPGTNKCFSNLLEVGDPIAVLKDLSFPVPANGATYHLQDVAGISWFAHQVPSMQQNGKYSFTGSLASVPGKCQ